MSKPFFIAQSEIRSLFASPIAWLVLVVFMIQAGMAFLDRLDHNLLELAFGDREFVSMTASIYGNPLFGVFNAIISSLLVYIPLLTMGLVSRELSSGSIKLLYSAPVRIRDIVLGKYLAVSFFVVLMVSYLGILAFIGGLIIDNQDDSQIGSGLLGVLLVGLAYAAIGLLMSVLTRHQIVAALSTIALLAALEFVGTLGQTIPVLADFAYWLSIDGRANYMLRGLISSSDVIYFALIIAAFLAFSYAYLVAQKVPHTRTQLGFKYLGIGVAFSVIGLGASLPAFTLHADTTRIKSMTLSPGVQAALSDFDGRWTVNLYGNILDRSALIRLSPENRRAIKRGLFENYQRLNPDLDLNFIYFYADSPDRTLFDANPILAISELAEQVSDQNNIDFQTILTPDQIHERLDRADDQMVGFFELIWNGDRVIYSSFDDPGYFPDEAEIAAAISNLMTGKVKVGFSSGNGERSAFVRGSENLRQLMSQANFRGSLINNGFDVREVDLDTSQLSEMDILVVAAPTKALTTSELGKIEGFVRNGGNLLLLVEPNPDEHFIPLLRLFGIEAGDNPILMVTSDFPRSLFFANYTELGSNIGIDANVWDREDPVALPGAIGLLVDDPKEFTVTPILKGPTDGVVAVALAAESPSQSGRVAIVGDADFLSTGVVTSGELGEHGISNTSYSDDVFRWLGQRQTPVELNRPLPLDNSSWMEPHQTIYLRILLFGVLPFILSVAGLFHIHRRRSA